MFKIEAMSVHNFRGIREFDFQFDGENYAVAGKNGTGKSGVIDAIEFALTGSVSRLSGRGTRSVSVKQHAAHVDFAKTPQDASVALEFSIPGQSGIFKVERTVKEPAKPMLTPATPEAEAALRWAVNHPEFALTRREIVNFILAEGKNRSDAVQALLRLERITETRSLLQKIANADRKTSTGSATQASSEGASLRAVLGTPGISKAEITKQVDELRAKLGLSGVAGSLSPEDITLGVQTPSTQTGVSSFREQWLTELDDLHGQIETANGLELEASITTIIQNAGILVSEEGFAAALRSDSLLEQALDLFDGENCPVCDTEWDSAEFRLVVLAKRQAAEAAARRLQEFRSSIDAPVAALRSLYAGLSVIDKVAGRLLPAAESAAFAELEPNTKALGIALSKTFTPEDIAALSESAALGMAQISALEKAVRSAVDKLPKPSEQDDARVQLHLIAERKGRFGRAQIDSAAAERQAVRSTRVFEIYERVSAEGLTAIYTEVETLFARLYALVNNDDEADFLAKLSPSGPGLDMEVAFYDRGMHPPGAYHSEGHQDAMGLCLYLALMKHTLGDTFTFAALDDVLMSIDSGHRTSVGKMLLQEFPGTQFVITTHDEQWMRQMRSQGLVTGKHLILFKQWSVDTGPIDWASYSPWAEIDSYLSLGDVRASARALRAYLEYVFREICDDVRAPVRYRSDGQNTLGELIPKAAATLRNLLKKGKSSAKSWSKQADVLELEDWDARIAASLTASQVEQWAINIAVHFNSWENLDKSDFEPVVTAMKALVSDFTCAECGGLVALEGPDGAETSLRCACSTLQVNLVEKAKDAA